MRSALGLQQEIRQLRLAIDQIGEEMLEIAALERGGDGVEAVLDQLGLGGIEDAEFASENAQLWEPTIPLEPERPTNPAAFGVRPSDLDKPVRKPWEFPRN